MKKRLLIIGIFILIVTIATLVIILSSDVSDSYTIDEYLIANGYKLVDEDSSQYIKETTKLDNFYNDQKNNIDSGYLAYYFSLPLKTFKEYKMDYYSSNNVTTTYTLSNRLDTDIIEFNYEVSNLKDSYNLEGKYDIKNTTFNCEIINNELIDKESYCNSVMNMINDFIPKRDKLLKNDSINKAINTTQNEVKVKG